MKAFVSWSGGKDSCLALYRGLAAGYRINALFCMLHEGGKYSRSHGLPRELFAAQARAMGLPISFACSTWEGYEEAFKEGVEELRRKGVRAGIFGDIDLAEHREWVERISDELGILPLLPLWGENRRKLVEEFIDLGFRALVVSVRKDCLLGDWLGRTLDREILEEMERAGIDPAGENGEFHTFVYAGPLFREPVRYRLVGEAKRGDHLQAVLQGRQGK
ncbi:Dph6-related ATP pyrophosphatase [Candidatus Solincola sp.]|nr:diphthine--ammonia ligase [Actinomycetota bacterium]MDI7252715.1 diphthine--ammonia ligase [Actinomycetota bacterium]